MRRKCSASAGLRCRTGSARDGTDRTEARSDILGLTVTAPERGYESLRSVSEARPDPGCPWSLPRPDDLVELLTLYVGVDLHPQRKVIGHLEGERRLLHVREQLLRAPGVEIDHARLVREILRIAGVMQNLIVALVLGQVRAEGLALEGGGHLKPFPGQSRELLGRFDIAVPDYDEILVLGGLLVPLQIDPFFDRLPLQQSPRGRPPLRVRRQEDEIETAGAERRHEGLAPPVEFGQIQVSDFLARWIGSGGESAECDRPLVVNESDAFIVSARISQRVGIDDPPCRPDHFEDAARIARQRRSGVAGMSKRVTPACRSASDTAFMSAGSEPLTPASPTPFAPSGFVAVGTGCSRIARPFTRPARGIG